MVALGHGFLQRPWRYAGLLTALAARGHVVVAPDTQAGPLPSHRRLADDLWRAAEWAVASQPDADPARIVAAGHSMGGGAALLAATRHKGIVAAVGIAALDTRPSMRPALLRLPTPVLLVVGSMDSVVPPLRTRELYAALRGPAAASPGGRVDAASGDRVDRVTWRELDGAGHCGWLDASFPRGAFCGGQRLSRSEQVTATADLVTMWLATTLAEG